MSSFINSSMFDVELALCVPHALMWGLGILGSSHCQKLMHIRLIGDFKVLLGVSVWVNDVCPTLTDHWPLKGVFLPLTAFAAQKETEN